MKQEPTFLACGEALMDVFLPDPRVEDATVDVRTGGSPFNVAIGLARLSQSVAYLGGISRDAMGERLLRTLEDEGVDTSLVARTHAPTTQSLVGVDREGMPSYEFRGEAGPSKRTALIPEVRRSGEACPAGVSRGPEPRVVCRSAHDNATGHAAFAGAAGYKRAREARNSSCLPCLSFCS
ncbi:MAG: hypothetical protein H7066_06680 [Cytophagaceae bacterium]|nr:hypothetical protein [Gemmatimonadaceae bacterium]